MKQFLFKKYILAIILACQPQLAYSQVPLEDYLPRCGGAFDLCGYIQRDTDVELIPKQYERTMKFSEGLAAVRVKGSFGFIDPTGKIVIKPQFDLAGAFYQGLAEVLVGDVVGVIDHNGEFVVEPQFARAFPFTKDTLIVSQVNRLTGYAPEHIGFGDLSGKLFTEWDKFGLYHIENGWVTLPIYKFAIFDEPGRGLIWARQSKHDTGPYGLLRADGTWQVEPVYSFVSKLHERRAAVRGRINSTTLSASGRPFKLSGAVDANGVLVIPLEFGGINYWQGGYALARQQDKYGLLDPDGNLLGGRYFDEVDKFRTDQLPRVRLGEAWFSIKPDGSLVDDPNGHPIKRQWIFRCSGGLIAHEKSGMAEFSHPTLSAPITPLFERTTFYSQNCDSPVAVRLNGKWGYVTQDGRVISNPPLFEEAYGFKDGFAAVSLNGAWGIIDESGKWVVEPKYTKIRRANGLIDERGRLAIDPYSTRLRRIDGLYWAEKDGRQFWIDPYGNEVPR